MAYSLAQWTAQVAPPAAQCVAAPRSVQIAWALAAQQLGVGVLETEAPVAAVGGRLALESSTGEGAAGDFAAEIMHERIVCDMCSAGAMYAYSYGYPAFVLMMCNVRLAGI